MYIVSFCIFQIIVVCYVNSSTYAIQDIAIPSSVLYLLPRILKVKLPINRTRRLLIITSQKAGKNIIEIQLLIRILIDSILLNTEARKVISHLKLLLLFTWMMTDI